MPQCAATDDEGGAALEPTRRYLFTGEEPVGTALPKQLQMHCCGGTLSGEHCYEDPVNLTGVVQCPPSIE